jgi:hypothetical protein
MTQVRKAGTHAAQAPYLGNVLITESRKHIKNTKPNNILVLIGVVVESSKKISNSL